MSPVYSLRKKADRVDMCSRDLVVRVLSGLYQERVWLTEETIPANFISY